MGDVRVSACAAGSSDLALRLVGKRFFDRDLRHTVHAIEDAG